MLSYNQTPEGDPTSTASSLLATRISTTEGIESVSAVTQTAIELHISTFSYYFLESQNWEGVDVTDSDCSSDFNTDTLCTDSDTGYCIVSFNLTKSTAIDRPNIPRKAFLYDDTVLSTRHRYSAK